MPNNGLEEMTVLLLGVANFLFARKISDPNCSDNGLLVVAAASCRLLILG